MKLNHWSLIRTTKFLTLILSFFGISVLYTNCSAPNGVQSSSSSSYSQSDMASQAMAGHQLFSLSATPANSGIIDPTRAIDWSQAGIPGGVPNRTIICASVSAGASQATIQSALNSCPQDQVVKLAAGTYNVSGGLTIPSHVVLRGAGPQQTILSASGSDSGFIRFGSSVTPSISNSTSITSGTSQGSTSLSVSSGSGITVGSYLMITQLNDPSYVTISTTNGSCTWCDGGIGWNGTRVQGQIVEVTSVSGTTIGISPSLYISYTRTPLATRFSMGAAYAGVEDLQVYMNNSGYTGNFFMSGSAYSWIKNVESNFTDGDHAQLHWSYRNEIRDSYFHDAYTHSAGSTDADIFVANKTSGTLIENNILRRLHQSIMLNWGAAGNVMAYNYVDGNFDSGGYNTLFGGLNTHGSHPMFNLWEGNMAPKLDADYFWGSSSHNTAFRNWFKGAALITPPLTGRGAEQPANAYWASQALAAMDISQTARYYNILGNVIGSDRQKSIGWTPIVIAPQNRSFYSTNNSYGYTFGYANLTDDGSDSGDNSFPYSTAVIHGDYDYVQGTFRWDPSITNHNLSASFYLQAKPTWFGNLAWPAFGPDMNNPSLALVGSIPAKSCYDQGKMPNCLAGSAPPPNLSAPSNLRLVSASYNQVQIQFDYSGSGQSGFAINRKTGSSGIYAQTGTTSSLSFVDNSVAASSQYCYTAQAYDSASNTYSSVSNELCVNTLAAPAAAPVINSFAASPASIASGQSSTLSFSVSNATSLILNPGNLNVLGSSSRVVTPTATTTYTLTATNSAGSVTSSPVTVSVTTTPPPPPATGESLLTTQVPTTLSNSDGAGVDYELGMKFSSVSAGQIKAIKFYKSGSESGTHTGKIYSSSGSLLASVVFSSETSSGWQVQNLVSPLAISANAVYVVSVNTGNTYYVATNFGMSSQITNGNLRSVVGSNGVYGSIGSMPTSSFEDSNYFRDVVFSASSTPPPPVGDVSAPVASISSPVNGATVLNNTTVLITANASDDVGVTKVEFYVNGALKCTDSVAPYSCNWLVPKRVGRAFQIQVKAYDASGKIGSSQVVSVTSK